MEDTTIETVLKTFEDLYLKQEYNKAKNLLKENKKNISPNLWHYNMGTVQGKLNNWPLARYHFLEAQNTGMATEELEQNLQIVESKLETHKLEFPSDYSDYLHKAGMVASGGIFTTLSLLFLVIGLWRIKVKANFLTAGIFLALITAPLALNWWIKSWPKAIVTESQIIFEGPSAIFMDRGEIPPGLMVVVRPKDDWFQIIYPSSYRGWIKNKGLKVLEQR